MTLDTTDQQVAESGIITIADYLNSQKTHTTKTNAAASYQEVAARGYVTVSYNLNDYEASDQTIRNKFDEGMRHLANRMAQVKINNEKKVNRPLKSILIQAFEKVQYKTFITKDQISSKYPRKENLIFVLVHPQEPRIINNIIEKPHKGNLVLCRVDNGSSYIPMTERNGETICVPELYVPHPDGIIPFILTAENIRHISGGLGKEIRQAFTQGQRHLNKKSPPKKVRVREDAVNIKQAMNEAQTLIHHFVSRKFRPHLKPNKCSR